MERSGNLKEPRSYNILIHNSIQIVSQWFITESAFLAFIYFFPLTKCRALANFEALAALNNSL